MMVSNTFTMFPGFLSKGFIEHMNTAKPNTQHPCTLKSFLVVNTDIHLDLICCRVEVFNTKRTYKFRINNVPI